jgi:heme-degrading monooxygenase HmoA
MILEQAVLDVRPGEEAAFEAAFAEAQSIIASMDGYLGHRLLRCLERESRYLLLVEWQTLEAHTEGFRGSAEYERWRALLHHFYDPFPTVEHYEVVAGLERA